MAKNYEKLAEFLQHENNVLKHQLNKSSRSPAGSTAELAAPVDELKGTFPVVLYFGNEKDREDFIEVVAEAMPNAVAKKI